MNNLDNNQNDDEIVEQSFADFFMELPLKFFFAVCALVWAIAMGIIMLYIKFVR
jgi:hypothetical protein